MFACILCLYILSLFVWNIHFEGNITQQTKELILYLDSMGVKHGILRSEVSCEEIERNLRNQYPNILWVSAEMRGTRLLIEIKENADEDIVTKIEEKTEHPTSIAAKNSGVITSLVVRKGTPVVAIGDQVEAGQILVEGYYEVKNDAGEVIRCQGVDSDADIEILTVEDYTDQFRTEYEKVNYTENKRMGVQLHLFQKNLKIIPKIPFEKYHFISRTHNFHLTENFYLPFTVDVLWYLDYETETVPYTQEQLKDVAEQRFYKKYENILRKGVQIIEKNVKIDTNGKLCIVSGTVNLLVSETLKLPANIPEVKTEASIEGDR